MKQGRSRSALALSLQPSAFSFQLSAFSFQLSAFSFQLSAFSSAHPKDEPPKQTRNESSSGGPL
jgi:hypothetical protein